jgi:hypothetical protein
MRALDRWRRLLTEVQDASVKELGTVRMTGGQVAVRDAADRHNSMPVDCSPQALDHCA